MMPEFLWAVYQFLLENGVKVEALQPDEIKGQQNWQLTTPKYMFILADGYLLMAAFDDQEVFVERPKHQMWRVDGQMLSCSHVFELADPHSFDRLLEAVNHTP